MSKSDFAHALVLGDWQQHAGITPYPARLGEPWNGFANPYFDRVSADRAIADQRALLDALQPEQRLGLHRLTRDGDTILVWTIPRPGTASAEEADTPGRIEATLIDGEPHWNLGFGWRWEHVNVDGEPVVNIASTAQRNAYTVAGARLRCMKMTLRLQPRLRRRLDDGTDVIPLFAHLGDHEDREHTRLPVHLQIGTLTIAADGTSTLSLALERRLDLAIPGD